MQQQPSALEARMNLCASMYEHYTTLITTKQHRSAEELEFRKERLRHWESAFLNLQMIDPTSNQIPITPIVSHGNDQHN